MKLNTYRKPLIALAAGSLVATLAACGGGAQPSGSASGDSDDGGSTASGPASAWALTGGSEAVFQTQFDDWNAAHPDSPIEVEWFANDAYKEKIRTAVGSGNAPTLIFSWAGGTLADYVRNGAVADITDEVAPLLENIIPSVAANGQIDGKTYAVPNNQVQPVILYYNKEVFEEAGVELPTTYEELLDVVATLSDQGVIPISLAGASVWPELMYIQYLTDRIGGPEVFQAVLDGEADAWSDPAITEALTKIQELVDAGAFGDGFGSTVADGGADTALVWTGKAAMVLQGGWVYPDFLNNAPEFVEGGSLGYANFPAVDGGTGDPANIVGNPANFWSVSTSSSAEAQESATNFLVDNNLSDEAVDEFLSVGTVPPLLGLEDKIAASDDAEYLTFVYDMVKDAPHFQLSWDQALPPAQAQELLSNLSQIFLGEITPEQFVENMNATL
ncbi:extracellular solute-binding protein [Demequina pelophila]|uniref:extracellular solute-binding protein n=1 Tax=Demequina pelophila TaxID=1638984 RepID=UPI000783049B|nr:extracellular solute-binding protein [Demequina pelophila]